MKVITVDERARTPCAYVNVDEGAASACNISRNIRREIRRLTAFDLR